MRVEYVGKLLNNNKHCYNRTRFFSIAFNEGLGLLVLDIVVCEAMNYMQEFAEVFHALSFLPEVNSCPE